MLRGAGATDLLAMSSRARRPPFGGAARLGPLIVAEPVAVALDLDLLLAGLLADLPLLGHRLGVEPDPLAGHDPLLDHRFLLAQYHLMLGLRYRGRQWRRRGWRR